MGIRNLAYCLVQHDAPNVWKILAWDNVDLLSDGQSAQNSRRCCACIGAASWSSVSASGSELWCKACATGVRRKKTATRRPDLPHLPCGTSVKELRSLAAEKGWDKKLNKEGLLEQARRCYLLPWTAPKATHPSLMSLRQNMDRWLDRMLPIFRQATLIRLENQPVMKGPTMKSVQIMLFTLLGTRLEREYGWTGRIEFVHAGTKTKERETVIENVVETTTSQIDEGKAYRARKKTAEEETAAALAPEAHSEHLSFFKSRSKKSDLADAFLMALRGD
jgi:hypothetical protein